MKYITSIAAASILAARSIYVVAGAAAIYQALSVKAIQTCWKMSSA